MPQQHLTIITSAFCKYLCFQNNYVLARTLSLYLLQTHWPSHRPINLQSSKWNVMSPQRPASSSTTWNQDRSISRKKQAVSKTLRTDERSTQARHGQAEFWPPIIPTGISFFGGDNNLPAEGACWSLWVWCTVEIWMKICSHFYCGLQIGKNEENLKFWWFSLRLRTSTPNK